MNLDAVKARLQGVGGSALEAVHDAGNFLQRQRARLRHVGKSTPDKGLALGADAGRRHRRLTFFLQVDM